MHVELAEERMLVFADRFSLDQAEGRAHGKRMEAFGTLARVSGFLSKPKEDEYELVYRERRLQPFWRVHCSALFAYERTREYAVKVAPEVRSVSVCGELRAVGDGAFRVSGLETCREEHRKDVFFDGLSKQVDASLSAYLTYEAAPASAEDLAAQVAAGTVVAPPETKASTVVRQVVSEMIGKFEADRVLEETLRLEAVELYYRPVYAFRYRRGAKEAVVEFDGLTGAATTGGTTFEALAGKMLDPGFLLDVGVETVGIFVPGATVARLLIQKGVTAARERRADPDA